MNGVWAARLERLRAPEMRLMVVAFSADMSMACIGLAVQWYAIGLGSIPLVLGLLGTLGSISYTVGCLAVGGISDRWGRRQPTLIACILCATSWLIMMQARHPYQLLALVPFSGFGLSLLWPPMQAWLSEFSAGSRVRLNRIMAIFNVSWSSGIMLGPLLAGFLWDWHWQSAFVIPAVLTYLSIVALVATPTHDRAALPPPEASAIAPRTAQMFLYLAWIGNFASWFARGSVNAMFPKLADTLLFSHTLVGTLVFLLSLAQLVTFIAARTSHSWQYRLPGLIVADVLGLAGMALAALTNRAELFALGFILCGLCSGITYVSSLIYALDGVRSDLGRRSALHEAVLGLGIVVGPLVGGALGQTVSLHAPFSASAVVFGLAIVAQLLMYRRWREPAVAGGVASATAPV